MCSKSLLSHYTSNPPPLPAMQNLILFFHCNASKRAFLKWNHFAPAEILEETPASLTLPLDGNSELAKSVYVFQSETR